MTTKLTDEQVVRTLAERVGWTYLDGVEHEWNAQFGSTATLVTSPSGKREWRWGKHSQTEQGCFEHEPPFLTSRDALMPVLAALTKEERHRALLYLCDGRWPFIYDELWALLAVSPRDLAHAVAAAIQREKEGK